MTTPKKGPKLPTAVTRHLEVFGGEPKELLAYVKNQHRIYTAIPAPACTFTGWLQLKLSCPHRDATVIRVWAKVSE